MAHWAKVDENNIVTEVLVVGNDIVDGNAYLSEELGLGGTWVQTSYNTHMGDHLLDGTPFRKNYAVIGGHWDPERDAFYAPQPWPSWVLNETTCVWEPTTGNPDNKHWMQWDEENQTWLF